MLMPHKMKRSRRTPKLLSVNVQDETLLKRELWRLFNAETIDWQPVIHYYVEQYRSSVSNDGKHSYARSHEDVIEVAKLLRRGLPFETTRHLIKLQHDAQGYRRDLTSIAGTLYLVARLLTMMEVGRIGNEISGQKRLDWTTGSIHACVNDWIAEAVPTLDGSDVKFEKAFKASNLGPYAGLRVVWTDNLAEHLRLRNNDREVAVFHHAGFLEHHNAQVLPYTFRRETLDTLRLLFPQHDASIERYFSKCLAKRDQLDPHLVNCGKLSADARHIKHFYYWHDRLIILKQAFDDPEQKSLEQWLYDRRKRGQWYTFWVAMLALLLTVFFGFVQSIEGGIQVYKAYHPA